MKAEHNTLFNGLNAEQLNVYNYIISSLKGVMAVSFLCIEDISVEDYSAIIRSKGKITLALHHLVLLLCCGPVVKQRIPDLRFKLRLIMNLS